MAYVVTGFVDFGSYYNSTQNINLGPDGIKWCAVFDSKYVASHEVEKIVDRSYGLGIIMLLQALSKIHLQAIDWYSALISEFSPF